MALWGVNAVACGGPQGPHLEPEPWPEYLGRLDRAPSAEEVFSPDLTLAWEQDFGRAAAGPPAVGQNVIAVQEVGKGLTVFRRSDGRRLWREKLNGPGATGPLLADSSVYSASSGSDGAVYRFDLRDGDERWEQKVGSVIGPIVLSRGHVFVATVAGVMALEIEKGNVAWSRRFPARVVTGTTVWRQSLFVATTDSLYRLAVEDGSSLTARAAPGAMIQVPAVADSILVAASPDGTVTALNAGTLETIWKVMMDTPVFAAPSLARDTVYTVTVGGSLWRIPLGDSETASVRATGRTVRAAPMPTGSGILVGTLDGEIIWFGPQPSDTVWSTKVEGPVEQPPLVHRGQLVVLDGRGTVHVWH